MKKLALALVPLAFVFTACGNGVDTGDATPTQVNNVEKIPVQGGTDNILYDITLNDGTRCVVVDYDRGGGISCDFTSSITTP